MRLPDPEGSRAVLIGTATYRADSGFASMPEIGRSLADFAEFLRTTTGLRDVVTVADPVDAVAFAAAVEESARAATDVLLFYFVGHGVAVDNQLHLTHSGSLAALAGFSTVSYPLLRALIKASPARVKLVILDCCHSGKAFGREVLADGGEVLEAATDIDGAFVLTATDEKTKFAAAVGGGGRTAFTGAMLDILGAGIPSRERFLTMSALYRELRERLPAANMPKPKALERGTAANLALARNAACTEARHALPDATATAYFAQIRDLAPPGELVDRAAELAELAAFCAGDEPYLWWSAGPWAGKTALLSWFALHPPDRVRVVAFFITSRLPAQSDHVAFTDAVLEQLWALVPDAGAVMSGNRDALRRRLLEQAAQRAHDSDEKIVLLVDGLDEDRGTPSIASLLPARPVPGLQVVVASRPNPPMPLDVAVHHPLRACRRRELESSAFAAGFQQAARIELGELLAGSDEVRHVIGLVTVAGGLTIGDLGELTDLAPLRIDRLLSGVTGRTLSRRRLDFDADPVHTLAHETLQQEAELGLGAKLLAGYRREIHSWADEYRTRHWPDDTPRYLLTRYFAMVKAQGEPARMAGLALDRTRHDRMLRVVGGDYGARTEIEAVTESMLAAPNPDLLTMCELSLCRERIDERSTNIPVGLPRVFALLGEHSRAASLARSIPDPRRRAAAHVRLLTVARPPADHHRDRVTAESLVLGLEDFTDRGIELTELISILLAAGDVDEAEALTADEAFFDEGRYLAELALAQHRAGRGDAARHALEQAREFSDSKGWPGSDSKYLAATLTALGAFGRAAAAIADIDDRIDKATALAGLAARLAETGRSRRARKAAKSALKLASSEPDPRRRARIVGSITPTLLSAGFGDQARSMVADLERLTADTDDPYLRPTLESRLAACRADLGDTERAIALADGVEFDDVRLEAWIALVPKLIHAGRHQDAARVAERAESATYLVYNPYTQDLALTDVIDMIADHGEYGTALDLTRDMIAGGRRFSTLLGLAESARSEPAMARQCLAAAEQLVRDIQRESDRPPAHPALADVVGPLIDAGELERASLLADELRAALPDRIPRRRFRDENRMVPAVSQVASLLVRLDRCADAVAVLRRLQDPMPRLDALAGVASALREHGHAELGGELATAWELELLREDPASNRAQEGGPSFPSEDLAPARPPDSGPHRHGVLGQIMARLGLVDRAEEYLDSLREDYFRSSVQYDMVGGLVLSGELDRARAVADRIEAPDFRASALTYLVAPFAERDSATGNDLIDLAERATADLEPGASRDGERALLVAAAVEIGAVARGLSIARTIGDQYRRAAALTTAGNALAVTCSAAPVDEQPGLRAQLEHLLAEIWSLSRWHTPLRIVARIDPDLLRAILAAADEALRAQPDEIA